MEGDGAQCDLGEGVEEGEEGGEGEEGAEYFTPEIETVDELPAADDL